MVGTEHQHSSADPTHSGQGSLASSGRRRSDRAWHLKRERERYKKQENLFLK